MNKQKGFSVIIPLLALVLIVVIGFAGWYVWHGQQAANPEATDSATSTTKYLVINEWAVRVAYAGQYKLTYTTNLNDPSTMGIANAQLSALAGACSENGVGTVERLSPDDVPAPGPQTVAQLAAANPGSYAHIGAYYYDVQRSQSACSTDPAAQALQTKLFDVITAAHVVPIP